jgi:hypothetical protein
MNKWTLQAHSQLRVQPFVKTLESSFAGDVVAPQWAVRLCSAAPANLFVPKIPSEQLMPRVGTRE